CWLRRSSERVFSPSIYRRDLNCLNKSCFGQSVTAFAARCSAGSISLSGSFFVVGTLIEQDHPTDAVVAPNDQCVSSRQTSRVPVISFFSHRSHQPTATVEMVFERAVVVARNGRLGRQVRAWMNF